MASTNDCAALCSIVNHCFLRSDKDFEKSLNELFAMDISHNANIVANMCRRFLKIKRTGTHPERMIGKNCDSAQTEYSAEYTNVIDANLCFLLEKLVRNIDIFLSSKLVVPPTAYFVLSLLLDTLKECHRSKNECLQQLVSFKCASWLHINMDSLVQYVPNILRVTDMLKYLCCRSVAVTLSSDKVQLIVTFMVAISRTYPTQSLFETTSSEAICGLVDNDMMLSSCGPALCVLILTCVRSLLQGAEKTLGEQSDPSGETEAVVWLRGAREITDVFTTLVAGLSVRRLIKSAGANDQDLLRLLLRLEEIAVACKIITSHRPKALEGEQVGVVSVSEAVSISEYIEGVFSEACGLSTLRLFVHFLADAVCFDVSTCVDLITQTETEALEYFLRVMRALACERGGAARMMEVCCQCWRSEREDTDADTDKTRQRQESPDPSLEGKQLEGDTASSSFCRQHCVVWVSEEHMSAINDHAEDRGRAAKKLCVRERVHNLEWVCRRRGEGMNHCTSTSSDCETPLDTVASSVASSVACPQEEEEEEEGGEELYECVLEFLCRLRDALEAVNAQGLASFNCGPLVRRMALAILACSRQEEMS